MYNVMKTGLINIFQRQLLLKSKNNLVCLNSKILRGLCCAVDPLLSIGKAS